MIICPICKKEMQCLSGNHLSMHKLTTKEFKVIYPNYETYSEEVKKKNKVNSLKGKIPSANAVKKIVKERLDNELIKFNLLQKKCKECNSLLDFKFKNNIFCNKSCAAKFNNKGRKVTYSKEARKKLREIGLKNLEKARASDNNKNRANRVPKKIYNLTCKICNKIFSVNSNKREHKSCSLKCRGKLRSKSSHRENNTYGKSGYYQGIYCASSWELAFLIYYKDLGHEVKRCDLTFNYLLHNKSHTYFPDFIMDDMIYEIKGLDRGDVDVKAQAVIDAGYEIKIVRKKEIEPMLKHLKEKYKVKNIIELYDKKGRNNGY